MEKYCPVCNRSYFEEEIVCKDCNVILNNDTVIAVESPDTAQPSYSNTNQDFFNEKHHRNSKPLIIIGVIVVIALLVSASIFTVFTYSGINEKITKYYSKNNGPKVNLQSSLTGSVSPVPEQDYYAAYGFYYDNTRIGTAWIQNLGEEIFQGTPCLKTKTTAAMDMGIGFSQVEFSSESFVYYSLEDTMPISMITTSQYTKPSQTTQSSNYQWDREKKEMRYAVTSAGQTTNAVCYLPEKYWELSDSIANLQVGYSEEVNYTMDMDYLKPIEVAMTVQILEQEDVSVPNGDYENCYVIEIAQTYQMFGSEYSQRFNFWIDERGVMPQAEITTSSATGDISIMMALDEYYTTTPPEIPAA
jgi:hypothetical protein